MKKIIPLILISIILSACAGAPTTEPNPLGTPAGGPASACSVPSEWTIQLNRSGGIAGVNETMTLDSGGRLTVQSERTSRNIQKTISKDQVNTIAGLLSQACPFEMKPNDAGCADCFLYKFDIQMNGQSYVLLATDVTLTDDLQPLVGTLTQILQDAEQ